MASVNDNIGNYRLVKELASGAFGRVYRGEHIILTNRIVAIKLLHGVHLNSQKERNSFIREARLLEQLKHPYILPIVDVGIHNGFPYLVTEYAPNGSLYDHLQRQSPHPLSVEETITILSQVGQALQHAHQLNVVHRDLKPGNILFNAKGEALLADFGIATVLSTLSIQQATIVGTPAYMAPEQFKGTISKESDEYALGCIAYELFTGHKPFTAPDIISMGFKHMTETPVAPRQLNPKVPVHIEQAILKAMAKERSNRYTSVSAFIIGLGGSPIGTTQKTTEQWLNEGNILYRAKRYDKALDAYEHAIQLDPNLADAYYYKGYTLTNLNRYQEALDAYERAIQLAPNDAVAYNGKGYVLYNLNRYDDALAAYDHAIQLDPNLAPTYNNKGYALYNLNRYQEALEAYDHAIQLDSNYAYAYIGKGNALSYLKRYDEALVTYDRAIQLDPNYAYAYIGKGNALRNLKRYDEALVAYEHAIQLDPNNANYKKSYQEALAAYDRSIQLDPNSATIYYKKGVELYNLKRYQEALAAYERAIRLDPNYTDAYNNKGNTLYNLKRYQEALAAYEHAIRLDPNYAYAYHSKANALRNLKRYEEALAAYDHAIQFHPNDADLHRNKAIVLELLGKTNEAQQAHKKAKQLGYRE